MSTDSGWPLRIKDVLDRADMEEFITWYAKEKLKKLQRGSVKGFIAENPTIKSLNAFDDTRVGEIEKILQIRHLYTHQNGIVDDKFRHYFPTTKVNDEYPMTLDEFLKSFEYLAEAVEAVDEAARKARAFQKERDRVLQQFREPATVEQVAKLLGMATPKYVRLCLSVSASETISIEDAPTFVQRLAS